jgi:hypothetical protein
MGRTDGVQVPIAGVAGKTQQTTTPMILSPMILSPRRAQMVPAQTEPGVVERVQRFGTGAF